MAVGEVLDAIRAQDLRVPATPDDYTRTFVASLLNNSQKSSRAPAEQLTIEELIQTLEEGEQRVSKAAPPA
jgi:uncharacterized protein YceH (UPF0502 family)